MFKCSVILSIGTLLEWTPVKIINGVIFTIQVFSFHKFFHLIYAPILGA